MSVALQEYIDWYEALMISLLPDEIVLFSDTVHPEYQRRPAHGWLFPNGQKTAIKTTSGRKLLTIQGALDCKILEHMTANAPDGLTAGQPFTTTREGGN